MGDSLIIAVVSDLHCRYSSGKINTEVQTYLVSDLFPTPVQRNPIEAMKAVIRDKGILADLLLCPGDISDKVDKQGLISGWNYLQDIKNVLGSPLFASTVGNHDMDSRKFYGDDPNFGIKSVSKEFPTSSPDANRDFWSNHFCIINEEDYDLLILNSSYTQLDDKTCHQSSISDTTLNEIGERLKGLNNNKKVKIAMCHHHPLKHSNMNYKDGDSLEHGEELIELLQENQFTLFIHGHKHDPRLNYSNALPVFAAGSFSSMMNLLDLGAQNTFHLIEIDKKTKKGIINSWVYGPKVGWEQKNDTYFPCFTGFGVAGNVEEMAQTCAEWVLGTGLDFIKFEDFLSYFPDVRYLIPQQQKRLKELLINEYSLQFTPQLPNKPQGIFKMY